VGKVKKIVSILLLLFLCCRLGAQIVPEISFAARYIPEGFGVFSTSTFPLAGEIKAGINIGDKFYTGLNSSIHRKRQEIDGYNFDNKLYQFELELRRSFDIVFVPGLELSLSLDPGYLIKILEHNDLVHYTGPRSVTKKMTLSANTGVSYSLTKNLKASVWPGVIWVANKHFMFDGAYSSFYLGTGITYKF